MCCNIALGRAFGMAPLRGVKEQQGKSKARQLPKVHTMTLRTDQTEKSRVTCKADLYIYSYRHYVSYAVYYNLRS
jgi:hypothetical protein